MNTKRLLAHFDRTIDAPNAIPRLRRFVLDLAVRGKLVDQDPADEPAAELLERVAMEKSRLYKEGEIRKPKPGARPDTLYALPKNWTLVPLTAILVKHLGGGTPSKNNKDYWNGSIPWASVKDVGKSKYLDHTIDSITEAGLENSSSNLIEPGNLVVATRMGLGKVSINRISVSINQDLRALILSDLISIDYVYNFFLTHGFTGSGLTVKGIKLNQLLSIPFPLPPVAEQRRIVAKVDELMALIDQLKQTRKAHVDTRDRLTKASYARFSTAGLDDVTFQSHACFVVDALPTLTAHEDQVKHLRKTILGLSVQGKLVEQDSGDEPASELLKRIEVEETNGATSVRRGKRQKPMPDIDLTDAPYELPSGWVWARFPELGKFGRGKSKHRPRNDPVLYVDGIYPMIQTGDVARSCGRVMSYAKKYNEIGLAQSMLWPKGTLCITIAANIADSGILEIDACFPDSVVGFVPASIFGGASYFEYFVRTAKANLLEFAPATAQKNINLQILESVLIPLPPLAEQHRIVSKVDKLMGLCDRLEAGLGAVETGRDCLLESALSAALKLDAIELEAAESNVAPTAYDLSLPLGRRH